MIAKDTKLPEFALSLRGYDRAQVDDYVQHLQWLVTDAEQRAQLAEADARGCAAELKALREPAGMGESMDGRRNGSDNRERSGDGAIGDEVEVGHDVQIGDDVQTGHLTSPAESR